MEFNIFDEDIFIAEYNDEPKFNSTESKQQNTSETINNSNDRINVLLDNYVYYSSVYPRSVHSFSHLDPIYDSYYSYASKTLNESLKESLRKQEVIGKFTKSFASTMI